MRGGWRISNWGLAMSASTARGTNDNEIGAHRSGSASVGVETIVQPPHSSLVSDPAATLIAAAGETIAEDSAGAGHAVVSAKAVAVPAGAQSSIQQTLLDPAPCW